MSYRFSLREGKEWHLAISGFDSRLQEDEEKKAMKKSLYGMMQNGSYKMAAPVPFPPASKSWIPTEVDLGAR